MDQLGDWVVCFCYGCGVRMKLPAWILDYLKGRGHAPTCERCDVPTHV